MRGDKIIALVRSDGCDRDQLGLRLQSTGRALVRDKAVTRLTLTRPTRLASAEQLNGKPSPFAAAIDVRADDADLPRLAEFLSSALGAQCRADIYAARERLVATAARTWPLGAVTPGVKVVMTAVRKPGVSTQEFDARWSGPHAVIAMANPVKPWRYAQNLVTGRLDGDAAPLDGVGEQNFLDPNFALKRRALGSQAATGAQDAMQFQDLSKTEVFVGEEIVLKD